MHEQQQIYDYPVQSSQRPAQSTLRPSKDSIKQSLIQSFSVLSKASPTSQQLTQCHRLIGQLQKDPSTLPMYFQLIEQFHSHNETMTKLVITQIFSYMKVQSSFGFDNRHDRIEINRAFLQFFSGSRAQYRLKRMLQNSYMQFIFATHNAKIRQMVVKHVNDLITKIFATTHNSLKVFQQYNNLSSPIDILIPSLDIVSQQNYGLCYSLIHVLKCLFQGGNLQIQLIKTILPNCLSIYYRMTLEVAKNVLISVQTKQQHVFVQRVQQCAKFTQIYLLMFSKLDSGKHPTLKQRILHTRQFYELLLILMNISLQFKSFQVVQRIIEGPLPLIGQQQSKQKLSLEISDLVNHLELEQNFLNIYLNIDQNNKKTIFNLITIKKNSVEILTRCAKTLLKKKQEAHQKYPYMYNLVALLWIKIKDCLLDVTQKYLKKVQGPNDSKTQQMRKQVQDFFGASIKFIAQVVKIPSLYSIVDQHQNQIFFKLCLPWLISRKQHDKFQAQDYLFFRQDIVNKQNMSFIENQACSLLQSYLDNIDGAITSIMVNCTNLISFHLTKNPTYSESLAPQLRNSWVLDFYPVEGQIQSALTLIAAQSYLSLGRNDLALMLQKWVFDHKGFFLQINNDYRITTQFLIMYSYYTDNFYINRIQGLYSDFKYRLLHRQVLKFCCYLMKQNYDYESNDYKGKASQILYYSALDCLNNSLNHIELIPALYINFPPRQQLSMPHYMLPYHNYPFFPLRNSKATQTNDFAHNGGASSFSNQNERQINQGEDDVRQQMKNVLVHYRKIGLNRDQYIEKQDLVHIVQFLSDNLETKANIKIIELFIEFLLTYIKSQLKNQGSLINIPVVLRQQIPTQMAMKMYALIHSKPGKFQNRNLFETKSTQLLQVLHSVSNDAYYIYSLGLEVIWLNPQFWRFNPSLDDNNIERLLKCTDLVVRLALKHYSSEKGVNVAQLMQKIADVFTQHSYQYIRKIHKFNIVFGILLNLILLRFKPQKTFDFLYILITQKLMKAQIRQESLQDQQQSEQQIPNSSATDLLGQAFYLFLMNIYRNPESLNTGRNFKLLTVFTDYLRHFVNSLKIVTQLGQVFGKIFACCLCILEKQFMNNTLINFDPNVLEFLWRNILYSGKIYKTELEKRIVSLKLLNLIKQIIRRNDQQFSLERVENMYQTACSCVFYSNNKDLLMNLEEQQDQEDFDHDGDEQEWQNSPTTLNKNDTELYIEDQVLSLKKTSRQLLESSVPQIKIWANKIIESLPVAIRNFVKNKVINYQQEAKQVGLRKIIKVKRLCNSQKPTKSQIQKQNLKNKLSQLQQQKQSLINQLK